jgi:hypothetical protein
MSPGLLAVRAVNQYRRRDVLAYIGLRYYLENISAKSDLWIRNVSIHLVNNRKSPVYFRSYHFKEISDEVVIHRNIFIPGPNEALAETALLHECSKHSAFRSLPCVYSYRFPKSNSREGVFQNYFPGYRERHNTIADACHSSDDAIVLYTDIKKFYPSIPKELALETWVSACDSSDISSEFRQTGERLLEDQSNTSNSYDDGLGIIIGPMFSHLIANLVLSKIDELMVEEMQGRYTRYVDDIVIVGNNKQVREGRKILNTELEEMGFLLHEEGKDFQVDSKLWLEGARDFNGSESKEWISLIGNIKRYLLAHAEKRDELIKAFLENGIRIPLLDYSVAVQESKNLQKFIDWLHKYSWSVKSVREITIQSLVKDAIHARKIYERKINRLIDENPKVEGFSRKRLIPKLRFYAGRLIFLAPPEDLLEISSALGDFPELLLRSNIMVAIQSRDITPVLRLGANAVQAVSQVLRIMNEPVRCSLREFSDVELQGLAILRLNGITIHLENEIPIELEASDLNQFVLGNNTLQLMKSEQPFIREISCLRGTENIFRHKRLLETAFDRDEHLILDVLNQLRDSS